MKRKKLNTVLILVVAGIWVLLGIKFFKNVSFEQDGRVVSANRISEPKKIEFKKNQFEVQSFQRDPFLNKSVNRESKVTSHSSPSVLRSLPKKVQETVVVIWPNLKYYGFVKNHEKNNKRGLLSINGSLKKVIKNQKIENLIIQHVSSKSIVVIFNKETKTINKLN